MKILMSLADTYFPGDVRVFYEARSLIKAGHEVFLLCQKKPDELSEETVEGIKVFRVAMPRNYLWYTWNISCYSVYNPFWKKHLTRIVEQENIEALHIHDLPRVITGLSIARKFRIPLIVDLHENYSSSVAIWHSYMNWIRKFILLFTDPIWLWKRIEKFSLHKADRVITIVDEARDYYVADYSISPDKFTILMNTPDLDYFYSFPIDAEVIERYKPYFTITYIGNFGPHRGIQTAILAMPKIVRKISNARLLLVGKSDSKQGNTLKRLAKSLHMEKSIEFAGQHPFSLMPSYLSTSNVCLIPAMVCEAQTDASSPDKLCQTMAMSKPVIVASMKSLTRMITDTGAGLVYTAGNPESLADAVITLHRDSEMASEMGYAGKKAVIDRYNWDEESKKLINLYENL